MAGLINIEWSSQETARGIRAATVVAVLMLETIAHALDGPGPWAALRHNLFTQFAVAGLWAMYVLWDRDRRRRLAATVIAAIAALITFTAIPAAQFDVLSRVGLALLAVGAVGLGFMSGAIMRCSLVDKAAWRTRLTAALLLPAGVATAPFFLWLSGRINPVFDLYVFAFEEVLGARFSVLAVGLFEAFPALQLISLVCYMALPFGIAALFAVQRYTPLQTDILIAFLVSTVIGFSLYFLFPVVGPLTFFGAAFPHALPESVTAGHMSIASHAPRNGMPSLHATWAFLIWFNARPLEPLMRRSLRAFALFNLFATMGLPDAHWLTDLIVSMPLTVAVNALCNTALPLGSHARWAAVGGGFGLVAAWLVLLLVDLPFVELKAGVAWLAVIATLVASLFLEWLTRAPAAKRARLKWAETDAEIAQGPELRRPAI